MALEQPRISWIHRNKMFFRKRGGEWWDRIVCKFASWKRATFQTIRTVHDGNCKAALGNNIHKIQWARMQMRGATNSHVFA